MSGDNHYKTLGVNLHASTNMIRTNMHELIAVCHKVKKIDVQVINDALSKIFAASQVLSDENKRAEYDQSLSEQEQECVKDINEDLLPSCWPILKLNETDVGRSFQKKSLVRQREERLKLNERQIEIIEDFPVIDWNPDHKTNEEAESKLINDARSIQQLIPSKGRITHRSCDQKDNNSTNALENDDDDEYIYVKIEEDDPHDSPNIDLESDSSTRTSSSHSRPFRTLHGSTTSPESESVTLSGDVAIKEATTLMKEKEKAYQRAKLEMKAAREQLKETLNEEWKMESNHLKRRRDELEQQLEDLKFDEDTAKRKYLQHDADAEEDTSQSGHEWQNSMALVKRTDLSLVQFAKENPVTEAPPRWKPDEVQKMVELMGNDVDVLRVIGILASEFGYMRSKGGVLSKYKEVKDRWKSYEYLAKQQTSESGRLRNGTDYKRATRSQSKYKHKRGPEQETNIEDDADSSNDDENDI